MSVNIRTYATYGIYDEDTASCLEVGDTLISITYLDENYEEVTLKKVEISNINEEILTIETEDYSEIEICIDNIVEWEH